MNTIADIRSGEISLTDLVKNKTATFVRFADGALIYRTEDEFEFPITPEEAKGAKFYPEHKAMELMRWIRKQYEVIKKLEN